MGEQEPKRVKKHICVGLLAHVDAGKTTLSESMLYETGRIRKLGRVDHGDAYLDTHELEQSRGITIFSKQAEFELGGLSVTLLDTPGHVDFSAEMERTLQVLDYAILVINGADGVQGHTRTLWKLLQRYEVPVFLFINKMDQEGTDEGRLIEELKNSLSDGCIPFANREPEGEILESIAVTEEAAMEEYLDTEQLTRVTLRRLIRTRRIFPCYFGSALKLWGVKEFLQGLEDYMEHPEYPEEFGAKVYKITRDSSGARLTHMKITGGCLKVKELLTNGRTADAADGAIWEEKVNQIRIYSGEKYEMVQEAPAGMICAVTGLSAAYPGEGLGIEEESAPPMLEPVLSYRILLPEEVDAHTMLLNLRQLEEEDPMLHILWNEELGEIYVQLMGEIQIEILKSLIQERFGVSVSFDAGNIVYKETIRNTVEGVGHFEPLRHYAEVHLILEPGEPGSGLVFASACSEDMLDKNWQRLILTHLYEKEHRGVLTGSAITDMRITLVAGRAHLKHTEGGDFRQSTYRAVRQGLMQAESVLLEPYYAFCLELPAENVGRALNDIQKMNGEFEPPETDGEMSIIRGSAPVAGMRDYQMELTAYTRGRGRLFCTLKGYEPCGNPEKIIEAIDYDPEADIDNPTGSVFCSHGAGYYVPWSQVFRHMHIESQLKKRLDRERTEAGRGSFGGKSRMSGKKAPSMSSGWNAREEKELEDIFIRTYGKIERRNPPAGRTVVAQTEKKKKKNAAGQKEYLLVDGYNIIFAWEELKELAKDNIEAARNKLMDILSNYQGFKKCVLILVFDAYKVDGEVLEIQRYHNIHVVYTKEAETADQYIEKVVHEIGRRYHVTVATSDGVEQVITTGQGAKLISAREFKEEVEIVNRQIREEWEHHRQNGRNYLFDYMDEELAQHMEDIRLGKKEPGLDL
ncbi:MAG: TetM/TetW/TetO/TetS family tetracycline resistance ribosomal protection protein [Eubacteriales bacterium]|nr:TetM/TetW/TetO/TetS family tetracycline resistance ribosomal protection protein [Eubacteriales bacterium]